METLEQVRRRLDTFADLRGLVRTMKAMAAVSIHQNEQAVRALSVYWRTVELGLHVVLRDLPAHPPPAASSATASLAAVVFGSDHGMCGRFNDEIASHAIQALGPVRRAGVRPRVLAVGARVASQLEHDGFEVETVHAVAAGHAHVTTAVRRLLLAVDAWRTEGVERVWLMFNRHVSTAKSEATTWRLLPVDFARFAALEHEPWESRRLPAFSMERGALLTALLRQYFFVTAFRACLESLASESGARLMAMQAAEKNLEERDAELTAAFRRRRQDWIDSELLDVVSGYEAVVPATSDAPSNEPLFDIASTHGRTRWPMRATTNRPRN
jgi:F-type H+-transporting ATPase subunit gamma